MRLIDAEQLKHKINNSELYSTKEWGNVLDMVFDCETVDAVPVIRCKYCVHHHDEGNILYCDRIYGAEEGDMYEVSLPVMPDDYCSYGEKKIEIK